jgi:hypothetical protein
MRTQQLQVEPTRTKPRESHADNVDIVVDMVHALVALASMQLPARHAFGIPLPELEQQANLFYACTVNPTHLIDRVALPRKIMFTAGIRGHWRL